MENNSIYLTLIALLSEKSGVEQSLITKDTTIEEGLGVTGDEAEELIIQFSKRFNVDISNFNFTKYFYPEPPIFFVRKQIEPLSVEDLYRSIFVGKLE